MSRSPRQQMLARLRKSLAMDTLSPQAQARCEQQIALTERLDPILFTDWDPIGVHLLEEFDCEGEYDSYLPEIVEMVMDGASLNEIANTLYELEEMILGDDRRCLRRCHLAAAKILGCTTASDDHSEAIPPDFCSACQARAGLPPNALCRVRARDGTKPPIHYID